MSVTHFICPSCGAEVRVGTKGCPKCTKPPRRRKPPERKPWEQDDVYDGLDLDLPEDDTFDYEQFIADEFGGAPERAGRQWLWWVTGVILLIALLYLWL